MEREKKKCLWKKHTASLHVHDYCVATKFIWPLFISRQAINRKLLFWCYTFLLCIFSVKRLKFKIPFFKLLSFHYIVSFRDAQCRPVLMEKIVRNLLKTLVKPSFLSKYSLVVSFFDFFLNLMNFELIENLENVNSFVYLTVHVLYLLKDVSILLALCQRIEINCISSLNRELRRKWWSQFSNSRTKNWPLKGKNLTKMMTVRFLKEWYLM